MLQPCTNLVWWLNLGLEPSVFLNPLLSERKKPTGVLQKGALVQAPDVAGPRNLGPTFAAHPSVMLRAG